MATTAGYKIQVATRDDAEVLSVISKQTFADSFSQYYSPADLQQFLKKYHSTETYKDLLADPGFRIWIVADKDGSVVGYGVGGRCMLPVTDMPVRSGEVKRLYVLPSHQSAGLGGLMMDVMMRWFDDEGFNPIYIGVYSDNHGAQRLYRRFGFEKIGDYEFLVGDQRDQEFILARVL